MLVKYGTLREVYDFSYRYPPEVISELLIGCEVLDSEYGSSRNYTEVGGYSIVIDSIEDLHLLRDIIDYDIHLCEWTTRIGKSGYVSALYIMNNDFSIMVFMPEIIAPKSIINEIIEKTERK